MSWDTLNSGLAHGVLAAWLVALGLLPFMIYAAVALHGRWVARHPTVDGRVPRDHPMVVRYYDWKLAEANAQARVVPEKLSTTYAPKLAYRADAPLPLPAPVQPASLPSARELLALPGLVLGVAADGPVVEPEFLSVGIGGQTHSGKSVTLAGLAVQVAAKGGRIHLVDPHAGHAQSLLSRVEAVLGSGHIDVGATPGEAIYVAERAADELRRRMRMARVGAAPDRAPVLLAIDEWTSFMRGERAEQLEKLLVAIISEGRKFSVFAALSAQSWAAGVVGGSFVRNPLPLALIHKMRGDEARMLTGPRVVLPGDAISLPTGSAYALTSAGISRVVIPEFRLDAQSTYSPATVPELPVVDGDQAPDCTGTVAGPYVDGEALALFRAGRDIPAIVEALHGLKPGGRAYAEARREVEAAVRRALR